MPSIDGAEPADTRDIDKEKLDKFRMEIQELREDHDRATAELLRKEAEYRKVQDELLSGELEDDVAEAREKAKETLRAKKVRIARLGAPVTTCRVTHAVCDPVCRASWHR